MLRRTQHYQDLGADYFDWLHHDSLKRAAVKKLQRLGYTVTLEPAA
jgi:hypothetical protein